MKKSHFNKCWVNFPKDYMPIIQKKVKGQSIKCDVCRKPIKGIFSIVWQEPKKSARWKKFCKSKKFDTKLAKSFLTNLRYLKFRHRFCSKKEFIKKVFKK